MEDINDLEIAESKTIWVPSCGVVEETCSLRTSGIILENVFRFHFTKVGGQKVY